MWTEIFVIMLFTVLFLYWQSAQKVKEIALAATQRHCHNMDLQMLDGYVAHTGISLKKDMAGQWHIARVYNFEFSATGAERYNARIVMLGRRVESIQLEPHRF
ncbi:MAG: DUF3301 domain-containing protein [Methyloprofundus sp.]|nr:DUF3301 domain-containing protein [Methyloprofundus sp.]